MKISESDLEFWKTEIEYLKEELDEENGFLWAERFERMMNRIKELEAVGSAVSKEGEK